jgi:hypothetical protein
MVAVVRIRDELYTLCNINTQTGDEKPFLVLTAIERIGAVFNRAPNGRAY